MKRIISAVLLLCMLAGCTVLPGHTPTGTPAFPETPPLSAPSDTSSTSPATSEPPSDTSVTIPSTSEPPVTDPTEDPPDTTATEDGHPSTSGPATIAYIPLDNRPVNTVRVDLIARSAGITLIMPDESLYRTALDGQPLNPNGTQHGDGSALLDWLEECEADYYIISLDQILSGGLVNSRRLSGITDEFERVDRLFEILEGKKTILYDTVMRLAPTVGYDGCTLKMYQLMQEYGMLPRSEITGELTVTSVIEKYRVSTYLDESIVTSYLAARMRKLMLSEYLLDKLADRRDIFVYYGIDDSHSSNTIQTNEIAFIESKLKNGMIFAGTDEMGIMSVAGVICDHYRDLHTPTVSIKYYGADPSLPADRYDVGSLQDNMKAHITALHVDINDSDYDIDVLVYGSDRYSNLYAEAKALLARYKENLEKQIPTIIIDLNRDFILPNVMIEEENLDFACLLSYSAWNTAGNSIGIALSGGIARYMYLTHEENPVDDADKAFLTSLSLSFAKDISYVQAKSQIDYFIGVFGGSAENYYSDDIDLESLHSIALALVNKEGGNLSFTTLANLMIGKQYLTSLSPYDTGTIPNIEMTKISFPWYRTFEADIEIEIKE